ncbi:MAG: hypothetical protein GOV15_01920 [Candidatus Diapherotrites archaeon]|nr:hypothetical protein [Candidatus Diapherotrites archaeon]
MPAKKTSRKKTTSRKPARRTAARKPAARKKVAKRATKRTTKKATSKKRTVKRTVRRAPRRSPKSEFTVSGDNVVLMLWGFLVFFGFLLTEVLLSSSLHWTVIPLMWTAFVGIGFYTSTKLPHSDAHPKARVVWRAGAALGLLLTLLVLVNFFYFNLGILWFLVLGSTVYAAGEVYNDVGEKSLGVIWIIMALLLTFISALVRFEFVVLAVGLGVPLIMLGLLNEMD